MDEAELREGIRDALRSLDPIVELAIRRELASQFDLGHSGRLQFEIDPAFFGIHLIQTEQEVLPGMALFDALPDGFLERGEAAGLDEQAAVGEEVVRWLADRWQAAGGPLKHRPAYCFFHGGLDAQRYDLEQRRWCPVDEVWPDGP